MPQMKPKNTDDPSILPKLISFFKKALKGAIEFFEKQLSDIKISDGLSLLNLLKPLGKFLGQALLLYRFFKVYKDAIKLGGRLRPGCDLIYVPVSHPSAAFFRTSSNHLPIKIPGNQAYILVGDQLFFVDEKDKSCTRLHIRENTKRYLFFNNTKQWLQKEFVKKSPEEIKTITLSEKQLINIKALTNHRRPLEKIKGLSKPLFAFFSGSSLFLSTVNNFLKLGVFIASIAIYDGLLPEAISQLISVAFFCMSFSFISLNLAKTFSKYLTESDREEREILRVKLFQQTMELLIPLAVIVLAGLVWLGIATPLFSAFITVGFVGLPFFQTIFRGIDNFIAFQNTDPQRKKKAAGKFLKILTNGLGLVISGYALTKSLNGVVIEIGKHIIDLGQLALNSAGLIFTAVTVVCCLIELGTSLYFLVRDLNQLAIVNIQSLQDELQGKVVGHAFNIILSSVVLLTAFLGFVSVINPIVGVAVITALFLGNLVANKFFPAWKEEMGHILFDQRDGGDELELLETLPIKGISLPNLSFSKKEGKSYNQYDLSSHPSTLYGSSSARSPGSPKGKRKNSEEAFVTDDVDLSLLTSRLGCSFNSFDDNS